MNCGGTNSVVLVVVILGRFPTSIFSKACFSAIFLFAAFSSQMLRSELFSGGCLWREIRYLSAKIISLSCTRSSQVFQGGLTPEGHTYVQGSWESTSDLPPIYRDAGRIRVMDLTTAVYFGLVPCSHFWQPGQQWENRKWRQLPCFLFLFDIVEPKGTNVRTEG